MSHNQHGSFNRLTNPCNDGTDSQPACGYVVDDGVRVPYSQVLSTQSVHAHPRRSRLQTRLLMTTTLGQGFCCECSLSDILGGDPLSRGNLQCDLVNTHAEIAHCLRMDPLWYK